MEVQLNNGSYCWYRPAKDKRIEIALTYIYGIGQKTATKILNETGVNPDTRVKDMSEDDVAKLREYIDHNITVEGDLRRNVALNIKRLTEIGCYVVFVTEEVSQLEVREQRPTQELVRVL